MVPLQFIPFIKVKSSEDCRKKKSRGYEPHVPERRIPIEKQVITHG